MGTVTILCVAGATVIIVALLLFLLAPAFKSSSRIPLAGAESFRANAPVEDLSNTPTPATQRLPAGRQVKEIVNVRRSEKIRVKDPATGEFHTYDHAEDAPAWVQEQLRQFREQANQPIPASHSTNAFTYTNTGETHTYKSLDEMPPEIRRLFEDAKRAASSDPQT